MSESFLIVVLLGFISLCALVMTVLALLITMEFRWMLRQINSLIPHCDQTVQEARHTLGQFRQLLLHANKATLQVEETVQRTRSTLLGMLDQFILLKARAQDLWTQRFGNGARAKRHKLNRG